MPAWHKNKRTAINQQHADADLIAAIRISAGKNGNDQAICSLPLRGGGDVPHLRALHEGQRLTFNQCSGVHF